MWLEKLFRRRSPAPLRPAARPPGFAEDLGAFGGVHDLVEEGARSTRPGFGGGSGGNWRAAPRGRGAEGIPDRPFASTGPQGHRGRLREKLLERGPDALADYELLEMLLFFAFKKGDTKPLAKSLINRFGSFAAVLAAPQAELMATRGLGEHSVAALKLVQAAALRLAKAEAAEMPLLNNWDRLLAYLNAAISREKVEQFRILFLDSKNRLIADEAQAKGTVNHTPVYPREVIRRALDLHATALILVHNHPSGDPTPSRSDVEMTMEIRRAGEIFSVVVHDHLIIGNGRHLSFKREGLL
ncbi:DNA repair protein RadC [Roseomonas sp. SG15]|uniref:DNA repair protein RadC n=2 Tax=Roseomonas indoligenes TaxID=2820811 RepID=A0A940MWH3_9PROT|nr:DNA repair protein RadC [Pararoseomonas indoligenes]MBP0492084.1 DNA repair protein RadC [Pararoseomonas indoligenes]